MCLCKNIAFIPRINVVGFLRWRKYSQLPTNELVGLQFQFSLKGCNPMRRLKTYPRTDYSQSVDVRERPLAEDFLITLRDLYSTHGIRSNSQNSCLFHGVDTDSDYIPKNLNTLPIHPTIEMVGFLGYRIIKRAQWDFRVYRPEYYIRRR